MGTERIIGLLRVKNEEKYLPDLLRQMRVFCDEILLLDNGSTDRTIEIAEAAGAMVRKGPKGAHEGRDRRILHEWVAAFTPDWIYAPDGDDLLEDGGPEQIQGLVAGAEKVGIEAYQMPYLYLWGDRKHYRVDGVYRNIAAIRLFKYHADQLPVDREVHSMAVPLEIIHGGKFCLSEVRLLHLGYMTPEQRLAKYEWNMLHYPPGSDGYKWAGGQGYDHILGRGAEIEEV